MKVKGMNSACILVRVQRREDSQCCMQVLSADLRDWMNSLERLAFLDLGCSPYGLRRLIMSSQEGPAHAFRVRETYRSRNDV